ncbi:MAG: zinc ABC transporter substrate-binding protein [Nitrososphaera sp.]
MIGLSFGIAIAIAAVVALSAGVGKPAGIGSNISNQTQNAAKGSRLTIVASFFPMYEFTSAVAGDRANVSSFIPIGDEPHGWEPTPQEIQKVQDSQLFVYNGYGMEAFIPNFLANGSDTFQHTTFVKASEGIPTIAADTSSLPEDEAKPMIAQGGQDPHIWNDPVLAQKEVRNIANAMEKADPANAQYYEANAQSYISKLAKLDSDVKSQLSNCQTHTFVSFHNAFSYFDRQYNLTDYWLSGLAPDSELSPQDLARVESAIKQNNVSVVFSEDLVDPKLAESLASDVGAQTKVLSPLEGIKPEEQQKGVTFLDKWYENLDNLKNALRCQS